MDAYETIVSNLAKEAMQKVGLDASKLMSVVVDFVRWSSYTIQGTKTVDEMTQDVIKKCQYFLPSYFKIRFCNSRRFVVYSDIDPLSDNDDQLIHTILEKIKQKSQELIEAYKKEGLELPELEIVGFNSVEGTEVWSEKYDGTH